MLHDAVWRMHVWVAPQVLSWGKSGRAKSAGWPLAFQFESAACNYISAAHARAQGICGSQGQSNAGCLLPRAAPGTSLGSGAQYLLPKRIEGGWGSHKLLPCPTWAPAHCTHEFTELTQGACLCSRLALSRMLPPSRRNRPSRRMLPGNGAARRHKVRSSGHWGMHALAGRRCVRPWAGPQLSLTPQYEAVRRGV